MFSNLNNVGAVEVNAFQVQADVCIQKSIREGFGLTVSEALWKARPTIGGRVGGIVTQIADGETGYLVDSAERVRRARARRSWLTQARRRAMARRGKEHVRRRFLMPRLLRDWLALMHLLAGEQVELEVVAGTEARPVTPSMDDQQLLIVSNRGPLRFSISADGEVTARRGGGGLVTALSALTATPPGQLDGQRPDATSDAAVAERGRVPRRQPHAAARPARPRGVRPLLQRLREPDAVVHPPLPVEPGAGSVGRPERPAGLGRRVRAGQRALRRRGGRRAGRRRRRAPLVMVHDYQLFMVPRFLRDARAGRRHPPLHPRPVAAARLLARASDARSARPSTSRCWRATCRPAHPALRPVLPPVLERVRPERPGRLAPAAQAAFDGRRVRVRALPDLCRPGRVRAARRDAGGGGGRAEGAGGAARADGAPRRPHRPVEERRPRVLGVRPLPRPITRSGAGG